jgi:TetR/AcrR family transcriptional repressor of nem operon
MMVIIPKDDAYNPGLSSGHALQRTHMGYSQEDKAATHERVVKLAAAKFRETGIDGISVADLMKEAGLTHGGFYRHFDSRDDLVTEAVEYAMAHSEQLIADAATSRQKPSFSAMVDGYLNVAHRDAPADGCAIVALASDVARCDAKTRAAYTAQVERHLRFITSLLDSTDAKTARRRAVVAFSALVGALALARAVSDEKLSLEIMKAVAGALKGSVASATG